MRTFSVKNEISPSTGIRAITIEGELTLSNGDALKDELLATLHQDGDVHIVVKRVEDIDLSGLQLLVALKKQLLRNGIRPTLEVDIPDELRSLVECSGYINQLK